MMFVESRQSVGAETGYQSGSDQKRVLGTGIRKLMMVKPAGGWGGCTEIGQQENHCHPKAEGTKMEPSGWGHQVGTGMTGDCSLGVGVTVRKATVSGWGWWEQKYLGFLLPCRPQRLLKVPERLPGANASQVPAAMDLGDAASILCFSLLQAPLLSSERLSSLNTRIF